MSLATKKLGLNCTWNVVNVSLCNLKKYQGFFSPPFNSEALENSEWYLKFTPDAGQNGELSIQVARKWLGNSTSKGLDYDLAFFAADGKVLPEFKIMDALKTEFHLNDSLFLQRSQLYGSMENHVQRKDELCVRFRIWAHSMKTNYYLARTVLNQVKFLWNIDNTPKDFSSCVGKAFKLPTLDFNVMLDEFDSFHTFLKMRFSIFTTKRKIEEFAHCKISVIDAYGKEKQDLFDFVASSEEAPLSFQITTKPEYLFNGKLPLQWQFTFGVNEIIVNQPKLASDLNACQASIATVFPETTSVPSTVEGTQFQRYSDQNLSDAILVAKGIMVNEPKQVSDLNACQASTATVFPETTSVPSTVEGNQLQRYSDQNLSDAILVAKGIMVNEPKHVSDLNACQASTATVFPETTTVPSTVEGNQLQRYSDQNLSDAILVAKGIMVNEPKQVSDLNACQASTATVFPETTSVPSTVEGNQLQRYSEQNLSDAILVAKGIMVNEPKHVSDLKACQAARIASVYPKTTGVSSCLQDDLPQNYNYQMLTDAILVAGGMSFRVHTSVLRASSKVFCDLFSKKCQPRFPVAVSNIDNLYQEEVFYINDLHPYTLQQMLLYIYNDTCGAMQWDCAANLYVAASKYGIWGLQQKCQSVLKSALSVFNAYQICSLADAHKDEILGQCARNFICCQVKWPSPYLR